MEKTSLTEFEESLQEALDEEIATLIEVDDESTEEKPEEE